MTQVTARQRRLIEALLAGQSVTQACRTAGVGRRTYYRWLKQPHFQAALREAESDLLTQATRRLLSMQTAALDGLQALLGDDSLRPSDRLRAIQITLESALRLRQAVEIEARIADLERTVQEIAAQGEPPAD